MLLCRLITLLAFLTVGALPARASYFFTPVGHHEAFLGNAGSALLCSSGSAIYNPAGLGFCESQLNLSVSGTSIAYQETEGTAFYNSTGALKSGTILTSAIFEVEDKVHMGLFYSYPTNTENYFRFSAPGGAVLTQEIERQMALGGLSYGGLISSTLAWGFSIAITWSEMNSNLVTNTSGAGTASLSTERRMQQENYVVLNPGLLWQANDNYDLGITLNWRALNIYSSGNLYQSSLSTGQTLNQENFDRYTPHAESFFGMTLGQVFHFSNQMLAFDITYAPQYALPSTPEQQTSDLSFLSTSLGWQTPFAAATELLLGAGYFHIDKQQVYLGTIGVAVKKRTLDANIGLFYQSVQNESAGALYSSTFGFLYSSSLNY